MSKKLSSIPIVLMMIIGIFIIMMITTISMIIIVIMTIPYATRQLKAKKQNHYSVKEFHFAHLHHPFHLKLITNCGNSRYQGMEVSWLDMT
jgi:hypothetical protein